MVANGSPKASSPRRSPTHRATKRARHTDEFHGFGTKVIHQAPDAITGAVTVPISMATTYAQPTPGAPMGAKDPYSLGKGFEYSRTGNPTRGALELALARIENGKHAVAYSSGMAATSAVIHLLESGDHVVSIDDVYGGTQRYFRKTVKPTYNIDFSFVDFQNLDEIKNNIKPNTKMLWCESPTNPTLRITDIRAVAKIAKENNLILVVDNTFMTPYFQNPLDLGANIVVHSMTKAINGHSDVVMGCVVTNETEIFDKLKFIQNGMGGVPSPFDCYLALRGMKTLHLRMNQAAKNAQALAEFLESSPMVEKTIYPGLASHPGHEIAKKQTHGFGAMITFYVKGGIDEARKFLENLHVFTLAESLGAVESLAESPAIMTHASVPPEHRKLIGIDDNLVRLSVGVEGTPDLLEDIENALKASQK